MKQGTEYISTIAARSKEEALELFAKRKKLDKEVFTKIYEVVER